MALGRCRWKAFLKMPRQNFFFRGHWKGGEAELETAATKTIYTLLQYLQSGLQGLLKSILEIYLQLQSQLI